MRNHRTIGLWALWTRWQQLGGRAEPHLRSAWFATLAIGGYVLLLSVLMIVPAAVAGLGSADALGRIGRDGALYLTSLGNAALAGLAVSTFVLSIAAGAFAQVAFRKTFVSHGVLLATGILLAFPVLLAMKAVTQAAAQIAASPAGDNVAAAGVLLFWALMLNNAAKPLWDEARNRLANWLGDRADAFVAWFDAGRPSQVRSGEHSE